MKKWILIALAIFGCTTLSASSEKSEALSAKIIADKSHNYYVLGDGSCWKVMGYATRWRTVNEWWNNVQLVPENYNCIPADWVVGAQIDVYPKYQYLNVNEADASNQADLKRCTHLLVNVRTGQVLFAYPLETGDCITQVSLNSREEGYKAGYKDGKLKSAKDAEEIFSQGLAEGDKTGYARGLKEGLATCPDRKACHSQQNVQDSYRQGKIDGEKEGYAKGYQDGLNELREDPQYTNEEVIMPEG